MSVDVAINRDNRHEEQGQLGCSQDEQGSFDPHEPSVASIILNIAALKEHGSSCDGERLHNPVKQYLTDIAAMCRRILGLPAMPQLGENHRAHVFTDRVGVVATYEMCVSALNVCRERYGELIDDRSKVEKKTPFINGDAASVPLETRMTAQK